MSDPQAVDAAHVTGRARGDEHIARGQIFWVGAQVQQSLLRGKHDSMFRLFINLDLRMIWPQVALPARGWEPRNRHRTRMPGMTRRASAESSVGIRLADTMALFASTRHGRRPFGLHKRMRRTPRPAGLIRLREINLLWRQALLAINRRP